MGWPGEEEEELASGPDWELAGVGLPALHAFFFFTISTHMFILQIVHDKDTHAVFNYKYNIKKLVNLS
jgi:hypothetical protein